MLKPFQTFQLIHLSNIVLVISGTSLLLAFGALILSITLPGGTLGWVSLIGAFFCLNLAWSNEHHRSHDKKIYEHEEAWRNDYSTNLYIILAIGNFVSAIMYFF